MRIPRVYLPQSILAGEEVELPLEEGNHLARVLRRRLGDRVDLISQAGGLFEGQISSLKEEGGSLQVVVRVLREDNDNASALLLPWTVAVGIVKGESFELALRMATELGLEGIIPVWTERTVVRSRAGSRKTERWERIAREATKQCGRALPLQLGAPSELKDLLDELKSRPSAAQKWVALPFGPFRWKELSASLEDPANGRLTPALFLVGPEGGFTSEEVSQATAAGFEPLGLPTPVLRTPTAVALIAALGITLKAGG